MCHSTMRFDEERRSVGESDLDEPSDSDTLPDRQRAALQAAFENGYFEVPRKETLNDVAEKLDIPSSEASTDLRHGITAVLQGSDVVEE